MKLAITINNERVAPVFDVATNMVVVEEDENKQVLKTYISLTQEKIFDVFLDKEITHLICGAISKESFAILSEKNIQISSFVAGDYNQIIQSWLDNSFDKNNFLMPGCNRRRNCSSAPFRRRNGLRNCFQDKSSNFENVFDEVILLKRQLLEAQMKIEELEKK